VQVVVMEFGKRHNTADFSVLSMPSCQFANLLQTCCGRVVNVADLLQGSSHLVMDLLQGNWCNGFWPLQSLHAAHTDITSL